MDKKWIRSGLEVDSKEKSISGIDLTGSVVHHQWHELAADVQRTQMIHLIMHIDQILL